MKKNFIYNVIYQVLILILPLITVPYVSRILGAGGIGTYTYTYSIAYYFVMFAMLGLNNYGNRAIAKVRDDKEKLSAEFCSIYYFQIIMSVIIIIIYLLFVNLFFCDYRLIFNIQIVYIISTIFDVNWFFFGMEQFKLTIVRNSMIKTLSLILIFLFVKTPQDLWKYTLIIASSYLLNNIVLIPFLKKHIKFVKVSKQDILKHIKPNFVLFLPVIAVSIYKTMDKIMLGGMSNINEVGFYENAEKIITVPLTIITALGTVTLPRVSNMISNNKEDEVKKLLQKTVPFVMFLSIPMTLGLVAVGKEFSIIFFGDSFKKTGDLIQLLSITILFLSWANVIRTQYLIPKEKDKSYIISAFIGALINLGMNTIFIPLYGAVGACYGTIVAEFFVMFYQSWSVRKEIQIKFYIKSSTLFFITGIMMFIVVFSIGKIIKTNSIIRIIIQILIGCITYVLLNIKYIFEVLNLKSMFMKRKVVKKN